MKHSLFLALLALCLFVKPAYSAQSTITEAEGNACMGDDKSRKQTEDSALTDAKKKAVEFASTYIKSETEVKNFALEKDLLSAYAHAEVKLLQEPAKEWYKDPNSGDCLKLKIKAEVIPDTAAMQKMAAANPAAFDDPSAPLKVKAWTDKKAYKEGDKVKVYLKGNKPFYARVLYRDAAGEVLQLLPNPYRTENYFNGGAMYEIPTGDDRFDLEVSPPFGEENVIVYASSSPLGEISTETRGGVYQVKTQTRDIGIKSRGVKVTERPEGKQAGATAVAASEFFEDKVVVKTGAQPMETPREKPSVISTQTVKGSVPTRKEDQPAIALIPQEEKEKRSLTGEFVTVSGGCFTANGKQTCVDSFRIGKYEVTQGQWKKIMGNNPSDFKECGDDCPVENVSWNDVQSFISRLNSQTGRHYRLPTEAEWEYACRSGGRNEEYCGGDNPDAVAWHWDNSLRKTHPAGQKQANGLGIYDMSGNVWEWVQDWHGDNYPDSGRNPTGPEKGSQRVLRGGSWDNGPHYVRAPARHWYYPATWIGNLGFRLVFSDQ